jgi:signal transduction histidine kinase
MAPVQNPTSGDRAVLYSIAQVVAGHIHEVNNKLGSILLNAEMLAANSPDSEGPAVDIARNATDLLEMTRDMESALPRNLDGDMSLRSLLELASRLVRGILRKKKIELVLPELGGSIPVGHDHLAAFSTMLLVPLAFPRLPKGQRGILRVQIADEAEIRRWRVELTPPGDLEADVCAVLERMCRCHAWNLDFGRGWLTIEAAKRVQP